MFKRAARLSCLVALCLAAVASRQAAAGTSGPSGSVPDGVLRATLDNGLRVVIVPDRLAPVVTTELNYLAGSNDAPSGFPGTAHALEHMMFRGAAGLDRDQLSELGALLGGDYNADTTETVTQYFYTVPAANLGVALHVEALRMRGLNLDQADWEHERGAIEQEVSRDMSSPIYTYLSQLQAILFAGTPYEHDALGTRPSFDKTDAKLLRDFYDNWYAPNNAILVIAGDVQPDQALALVRTAFGGVPRRDIPAHAPITVSPVLPKMLSLPTDLPVGVVTLAYRMPGLTAHDFAVADILSRRAGQRARRALRHGAGRARPVLRRWRSSRRPMSATRWSPPAFPRAPSRSRCLTRCARYWPASPMTACRPTWWRRRVARRWRSSPSRTTASPGWPKAGRARWPSRTPSRRTISRAPTRR